MKINGKWRRSLVYVTLVLGTVLAGAVAPSPALKSSASTTPSLNRIREARLTQSSNTSIAVQAAGRGNPWINFRDGAEVATTYVGPEDLQQALRNNARPLSMASADFDEDGAPDLVSGYTSSGIGIMTLHKGNKKSLEAPAASDAADNSEPPFLPQAQISELPDTPNFLCAGDFDSDGHADFVIAARGGRALYLLSGNGHGEFSQASRIDLAGEVTAVAARDNSVNRGAADLAVALRSGDQFKVLVFAGAQGSLNSKPREIPLPSSATAVVFGQLDGDPDIDVAVIAGTDLIVANGRGGWAQGARLVISQRSFPFVLRSIAVGDFNGDQWADIALLSSEGTVSTLANARKPGKKNSIERWKEGTLEAGQWAQASTLLRARLSRSPVDDLVIIDPASHQLHVAGLITEGATQSLVVSLSVDGEPGAVLPILLNADAIEDLVVLINGHSAPVTVLSDIRPAVATLVVTQDPISPDPATVNSDVTLKFTAFNSGGQFDGAITNVILVVSFKGPTVTLGSDPPVSCVGTNASPPCTFNFNSATQTLTVQLGNLPPDFGVVGVRDVVTIRVRPTAAGTLSVSGTLSGNCPDIGQAANEVQPLAACQSSPALRSVLVQVPTQPNLQIAKTASASTVAAGSDVTYTITVSNTGTGAASNINVVDNLDPKLTLKSCSFACSSNPVQTTIQSLGPGQSQNLSITATVKCDASGTIANSATASITEPLQSVSGTANITVTNAGLRLGASQSSTIDFGTAGIGATVSRDLIVENTSGSCTTSFNISSLNRTGPDVSRISNRADTTFFKITRTDGTAVNVGQAITLPSGLTTFRVVFSPAAPARPGTNTNLSASQVLPTSLTTQLSITGITNPVTLTAAVSRTVKIVGNVALTITGDTFNVSVDVFSPDWADVSTFLVKLLDAQNNTVAQNTATVTSAIQQANLVRGQTFGLVQTGSGIGDKQVTRAEVTVSGPGGDSGPIRSASIVTPASRSAPTAGSRGNSRAVFSDVRLRQ